jgi:ribonuclease J
MQNKKLLISPNITTRGFVQINENEELIKKIEKNASKIINNDLKDKKITFNDIKTDLTKNLSSFIMNETGRKPIILSLLLDIKR